MLLNSFTFSDYVLFWILCSSSRIDSSYDTACWTLTWGKSFYCNGLLEANISEKHNYLLKSTCSTTIKLKISCSLRMKAFVYCSHQPYRNDDSLIRFIICKDIEGSQGTLFQTKWKSSSNGGQVRFQVCHLQASVDLDGSDVPSKWMFSRISQSLGSICSLKIV